MLQMVTLHNQEQLPRSSCVLPPRPTDCLEDGTTSLPWSLGSLLGRQRACRAHPLRARGSAGRAPIAAALVTWTGWASAQSSASYLSPGLRSGSAQPSCGQLSPRSSSCLAQTKHRVVRLASDVLLGPTAGQGAPGWGPGSLGNPRWSERRLPDKPGPHEDQSRTGAPASPGNASPGGRDPPRWKMCDCRHPEVRDKGCWTSQTG